MPHLYIGLWGCSHDVVLDCLMWAVSYDELEVHCTEDCNVARVANRITCWVIVHVQCTSSVVLVDGVRVHSALECHKTRSLGGSITCMLQWLNDMICGPWPTHVRAGKCQHTSRPSKTDFDLINHVFSCKHHKTHVTRQWYLENLNHMTGVPWPTHMRVENNSIQVGHENRLWLDTSRVWL